MGKTSKREITLVRIKKNKQKFKKTGEKCMTVTGGEKPFLSI